MKKLRLALFALAVIAFGSTVISCKKNLDVKPKIEKTGVYDLEELADLATDDSSVPKKKRKKR